jgi:hypothetical protein
VLCSVQRLERVEGGQLSDNIYIPKLHLATTGAAAVVTGKLP